MIMHVVIIANTNASTNTNAWRYTYIHTYSTFIHTWLCEPYDINLKVESCAELGWLLFEVPVQCSSVSNYW